jgi:type II secretory pathway component PulM
VLGSADFSLGVAELCLFKVGSLQAALAVLSRLYMFTKQLQEAIGSARKQHRRLDMQLESTRVKIRVDVQKLLAWVAQLRARLQLLSAADQVAKLATTGVTASANSAGTHFVRSLVSSNM